jgi:hypothetical protein
VIAGAILHPVTYTAVNTVAKPSDSRSLNAKPSPGITARRGVLDLSSVYRFDLDTVSVIVPVVESAVPHEPQLGSAHCPGSVARAANVDQSYRKRNAYQQT